MQKNSNLFYDLFDKVQDLDTPFLPSQLLEETRELYGLRHILYTRIEGPPLTAQNCSIKGTYPLEWLAHYFESDYLSIDPVVSRGLTDQHPFDWYDLPKETKEVQQIFEESVDFGFGRQGLTIPIVNYLGELAILNINADESDQDWAARKPELMRELQIISHFLHQSVTRNIEANEGGNQFSLSENELESLKWAASGKSVWETSTIVSLSERTVRFHLDQARRKLHCATKIQAVAKAVALRLINIS